MCVIIKKKCRKLCRGIGNILKKVKKCLKGESHDYIIKAALAEEALESWIWTNDDSIKKGFILIKKKHNKGCRKKVRTYKRNLDTNFIDKYNERPHTNKIKQEDIDSGVKFLVINEYYRDRLGIKKNKEEPLIIRNICCWGKFRMLFQCYSPNPTIRLASVVGIISVVIGIVSVFMPLIKRLFCYLCTIICNCQ
jgi:hypothetical protein